MSVGITQPPFCKKGISFLPTIDETTSDLEEIFQIDETISLEDLSMFKLSVDEVASESEKPYFYQKLASIYLRKQEKEKAFDLLKQIPLNANSVDLYALAAIAYSQNESIEKVLKVASDSFLSSRVYEAELIKTIFLSSKKNERIITQILDYIEKRNSLARFDPVLKELYKLLAEQSNTNLAHKAFQLIKSYRQQEMILSQ